MDKNKKKVLIIIGIILAIISLLAIILGFILKDKDDTQNPNPNLNPNPGNVTPIIKKEIKHLDDDKIFFSLQNLMNDYYSLYSLQDSKLYDLLESDYKKNLSLTRNNLFQLLEEIEGNTSFTPYEIYYNPGSTITYYFIKGYLLNIPLVGDATYKKDLSFLVIVSSTNNYVIKPLEANLDLENYAKNYDIKDMEINNNSNFKLSSISTENKLVLYLNSFKNLLVYDNTKAYEMLSESLKEEYTASTFASEVSSIYNAISAKIFSYATKTINGKKVFNIIDSKQNSITIYEDSIMNFTIDFDL